MHQNPRPQPQITHTIHRLMFEFPLRSNL